jgi:hypothetical protein
MAVQIDDSSDIYSTERRRSSVTAASNAESSCLDALEGFSELELDDIDTAPAAAATVADTSAVTAVTAAQHHRSSSSSASSSSVSAQTSSAGSPQSRVARHSSLSGRPGSEGGLAAKLKTLTSFKLPDVSTTATGSIVSADSGSDKQLSSPNSSAVPLPLAAKLERAEATLAEGWDSVEASVDGMLARARAAIAAKRPPLHPSPAAAAAVSSPSQQQQALRQQQQQQQHARSGSAFSTDSAEAAAAAVVVSGDQEGLATATAPTAAVARGPNTAAALSGLRASFSESVRRLSEHSALAGTGGHSYSSSAGSSSITAAGGGGSGSPTATAAAVAGRHNSGASSVGGLNAMRASFSERVRRVSAVASTAVAAATAVDSATANSSTSSSTSSSRPSVGAALQERMEKLRSSVQAVLDGDGELDSAAIVAAAPLAGEVGAPQQRTGTSSRRARGGTDDDDFWDPFEDGSSTKQRLASAYSPQPQQQQQQQQRKPAERR